MAAASNEPRRLVQTPSILIVDNDESVTCTFSRILRLEGYDVRTALSADEAFRQIVQVPPDGILLDLRMPLVDGLTFLRRLRAREDTRAMPVAVITGDYFLEDNALSELGALGASVYLKPLRYEELVKITIELFTH